MAFYINSIRRSGEIIQELDHLHTERNAWIDKEIGAATKLQTRFRSSSSKKKFLHNKYHSEFIQRCFRGYLGRKKYQERKENLSIEKQKDFAEYFAECIQRIFRGYFSRKHKHDFHERRRYIKQIYATSDALKQQIKEYEREAEEQNAKIMKEESERKFKNLSTRMHYLVSTKSQDGVFRRGGNQPTVNGVPIETSIHNNVKDYLKKNNLLYKKRVTLPKDRRSLQASCPYDVVRERRRMNQKLAKLKRSSQHNFIGGTKAPEPVYKRGINEGDEYRSPLLATKSVKEMLEKQKDKRVSTKPFHVSFRNKGVFE